MKCTTARNRMETKALYRCARTRDSPRTRLPYIRLDCFLLRGSNCREPDYLPSGVEMLRPDDLTDSRRRTEFLQQLCRLPALNTKFPKVLGRDRSIRSCPRRRRK